MGKTRFSGERMVAILREADRGSVAEAVRKNKVSDQTIDTWRKHFNGLEPSDVKGLKALGAENAELKRLLGSVLTCLRRSCRQTYRMLPAISSVSV